MSDSFLSVIALLCGAVLIVLLVVFVMALAGASWRRAQLWRQVKRDSDAAAMRRTLTADHRRKHVA